MESNNKIALIGIGGGGNAVSAFQCKDFCGIDKIFINTDLGALRCSCMKRCPHGKCA